MSNLLATALGLLFTLFVCLYVAHALLSPWLHMRSDSADVDQASNQQRAHGPGAVPFRIA
jgi:hypothetical protein